MAGCGPAREGKPQLLHGPSWEERPGGWSLLGVGFGRGQTVGLSWVRRGRYEGLEGDLVEGRLMYENKARVTPSTHPRGWNRNTVTVFDSYFHLQVNCSLQWRQKETLKGEELCGAETPTPASPAPSSRCAAAHGMNLPQ